MDNIDISYRHNAYIYNIIIEKFTVNERLSKMVQNSWDGQVPVRLAVGVCMQFWTYDVLVIFDVGLVNHGTKCVYFLLESW